ncbi:IS200/IS605 family transposase [Nocardia otitidiscaviarum]|uniref:IS200/IS605 family transposase n=1 Tax=Nocardia otitidiscaviarum TaxID=1823 RepID=UPI0018944093|nr:IS200/IS605 family transposase [Nocardia otitidiscaviarum]MBF6180750.1 IS200/IS605 family transposase [Nocardia otitidiscaviarum]
MPSVSDIRTGRHVTYTLHAHLVFVTKYRHPVFTDTHLRSTEQIMRQVCQDFEAELVEFNGEPDHIHLLVHYPPKLALAKLVNSLKGVSSRLLRKEFEDIRSSYWAGKTLWSRSYFAGSVGGAPISILRQYIQQQTRPTG